MLYCGLVDALCILVHVSKILISAELVLLRSLGGALEHMLNECTIDADVLTAISVEAVAKHALRPVFEEFLVRVIDCTMVGFC